MKVIVLGTNHAGTVAVRTLKRLNPNWEIVTYDKSDVISFLGCGIALWVKGDCKDPKGLFYASSELLAEEGIIVKAQHEWINIDKTKKEVTIKNLQTGEEFIDKYDKLIVSTGTWPVIPPILGIDLPGVQICKNYAHAQSIHDANLNPKIKNITVVGAGYIGVELAEAFTAYGKKVTLIDVSDRIMPNYFDEKLTKLMEDRMVRDGVSMALNQKVVEFKGKDKVDVVVTDKGEIKTDYVVFSVGVKPQTEALKGKVDLDNHGAIITNDYCQTSDKDIYAIGDCSTVFNVATKKTAPIQLATTAVRTGIVAAINISSNNTLKAPGFTGANGISVFGFNMAAAGISETYAKSVGIEVESIEFTDNDRPEFMEKYKQVWIKLIWEKKSRRIVGAQVASENNHTEVMYMFALAIQKEMVIDEIPLIDIFFLPHFNKPYNFITLAGLEVLGLNFFKK
ncbi:FAD-dependent oxidoreductase [Spiroplasma endosymbiont of Othius punctulatus]|uniref:FAD-dependent oxidoreductase n=1 Tax=Spiroplasma endosymbiont of Othius punctulatus TaxID=3066289 RepID=UPI0030D358AD